MRFSIFIFSLALLSLASGCRKDPKSSYTVPTTYNFTNADVSTSVQRLNMLAELVNYIRTTHSATDAPILDAVKLKNMYSNFGNPFADSILNSGGLQLRNQASLLRNYSTILETAFDDAVIASTNAAVKPTETTASEGKAGKMINGTRYILVDSAGLEYKELAEKGMMGAITYYQAMLRLNQIGSYDNVNIANGSTAQERAWDEAFGYFGVPIDFPANTAGLKNWGNYCNTVSQALGGSPTLNQAIMNAWIHGRAAISNKDDATRDQQRDIIVKAWEKVAAARFISYSKGAKANVSAPATYHHNLSEAIGFLESFYYNPSKTIADADLETLQGYFRKNDKINLYRVSLADLDTAIQKMATLFSLDAALL